MKLITMTAGLLFAVAPSLALADAATDNKIEETAKASYNYKTLLEDNVKVKAKDGVVTLTGTVPEADHRALAEDTARSLPGVVRVDNQIKIAADPSDKSDKWLAAKIRTKLLFRGNVSATNTKVDVLDGNVTLRGNADSMAQKELTTEVVKAIDGVRNVDNQLIVAATADAQANTSGPNRTIGERIDDASITAQVKYSLISHKSTSGMKTNVTTKEGVVTIEGDAANSAEKDLVTNLATNVRGVRDVNNNMTVRN